MKNKFFILALLLLASCLVCAMGVHAQTQVSQVNPHKPADSDWGPLVGPWKRYDKNPVIKLEGEETYSIQNGPQSVIKWKGKWHMFLMTSQPIVTKMAVHPGHHPPQGRLHHPQQGELRHAGISILRLT